MDIDGDMQIRIFDHLHETWVIDRRARRLSRATSTPKLDANTAIMLIRQAKPRSLESVKQEQFVTKRVSHRWAMAYHINRIAEPCTLLRSDDTLPRTDNALLFLIGKPGSTSHGCRRLCRSDGQQVRPS